MRNNLRASLLILFIQPVNKVKTSPGSFLQALRHGCITGSEGWGGSSAVITPAGNQRTAELKDPPPTHNARAMRGPHRLPHVQTPRRPRRRLPRPAVPPPGRCWLKCSRLLAPHSGTGGRGAFWIIMMLLRCHLQHKTRGLDIPATCERFFFFTPPSS